MLKPGFHTAKIQSAKLVDGKIQFAVTVNELVGLTFKTKLYEQEILTRKQQLKASIAGRILDSVYGGYDNMDALDLIEVFDMWGVSGCAVMLYHAKRMGLMK